MQEQQQQEQQEILLRFKLHVITLFSHPHGENKAFKRSKVTTSHSGPAAGSGKKLSIIRDRVSGNQLLRMAAREKQKVENGLFFP